MSQRIIDVSKADLRGLMEYSTAELNEQGVEPDVRAMIAQYKEEFDIGMTDCLYRGIRYYKQDPVDTKAVSASIEYARSMLEDADGILIVAGAGMGCDSGLPDFRGSAQFWPDLEMDYEAMSDGKWFHSNPRLGWGLNYHQLKLYRSTKPHNGFTQLLQAAQLKSSSYFVWTSNIDGQFQDAQFDKERVYECHGSIRRLQCLAKCIKGRAWTADNIPLSHLSEYDRKTYITTHDVENLPHCDKCNGLARPNIWLCSDQDYDSWDHARSIQTSYYRWLEQFRTQTQEKDNKQLVVIECGAGKAIASCRGTSEDVIDEYNARLIRINPRDYEVPFGTDESSVSASKHVGIPLGALEGLTRLLAPKQTQNK